MVDGIVSRKRLRRLALGASVLAAGLAGASSARPLPATPAPAAEAARTPAAVARPNLIVIMGDDIGYSDIGAFGGEVDTPNIDALAKRSISFTNFFNMSRCCPTRASLITGRYPHRVGMPGNGTSLSKDVPTVAEELRDAGYATTMVGKWHLTEAVPLPNKQDHLKWLSRLAYLDRDFGDKSTYPAARGFQHHYGIIWGVTDYYNPFSLVNDFTPAPKVPNDFYLTDSFSDHAVSEVNRLGKGQQPFMMYLAYTAAHWPLMAPENLIQKYIPRYTGGWDVMRDQRYARQVKMGLVDPRTEPRPALDDTRRNIDAGAWSALTPDQKAKQTRKMATHAAMIEKMDQGIGRLVAALKANGQYDNTVIMFLIDNGASPEIPPAPGYDRDAFTRDGTRVAYGMYADGIGTEATWAGIGAKWASAANTPWRFWKKEAYQGGIHTPFLISWPGHMGGREGAKVTQNAHVIDITPTLLDLAGVKPRASRAPMDGVSLAGVLQGRAIADARPLYFEHYGSRAVIDGRWKAVSLAPPGERPDLAWSLYDMTTDRTETQDVRAAHPDIVARLNGEWTAWAKAVGVPERGMAPAKPQAEGS